jgi:hypothetical protein
VINSFHTLPYYKYTVTDWPTKKIKMQEAMKHQIFSKIDDSSILNFYSDRSNYRNYDKDFLSIFEDELGEFGQELKLESFKIEDMWTVEYHTGQYHSIHTHGNGNLSAILYFDQDEIEHSSTHFVVGTDYINNTTEIVSPPIKEGEIIIFPSHILHFTTPNNSKKTRRIISFDITFIKKFS